MAERVWEKFLTEQDKATLVNKPPRPIGFGERPALLLIDLYRWVFGDKPRPLLEAVKTWPSSCGLAAWQAIPPIQTLLQVARETRIPIIHMTGLDHAGVEGWSTRRGSSSSSNLSPEAYERLQHRYDIID